MAYTPPQFNLLAHIWDCRFPIEGGAPDWINVPVQKYILSRPDGEKTPAYVAEWWTEWQTPVMLRFSRAHAAFAGRPTDWTHTVCEVPAGSGSYRGWDWDDCGSVPGDNNNNHNDEHNNTYHNNKHLHEHNNEHNNEHFDDHKHNNNLGSATLGSLYR